MEKPLQIARPELKSARALTPLQLNAIRVGQRHTVLTPERLRRIRPADKRGAGNYVK